MNIEKQLQADHQIKLVVTIDPEPLKNAKQRGARKIAQRVKIPGFRPGKAPYQFVERYVGEGAIMEEAVQILIDETYPKLIDETGIQPYGPGSLENIPSQDPLKFEFLIPLRPEVTLGDYHAVRMPYTPPEVGEKDVEQVLNNMREQRAATTVVERPAQPGDQVYVQLSAVRSQPAEGEEAEILKERRQLITIEDPDAADDDEWPFPGFSKLLINLAKGSQITHSFTFPENSPYESLRNVRADFVAVVDEVRERTLPELNDEFARTVSKYETVEALHAAILTDLQRHRMSEYLDGYNDKILAVLLQDAVIHYPPQALDDETESYQRQFERQLSQQNMELETYIKMRGVSKEEFITQEVRPVAKSRLERSLVLSEVAKQENIKLDRAALEDETAQTLSILAQSMEAKERGRLADENFIYSLTNDVASNILMRQTWERLQAIAKGEQLQLAETDPAPEAEVAASEQNEAIPVAMIAATEAIETAEIAPENAVPEEAPAILEPVSVDSRGSLQTEQTADSSSEGPVSVDPAPDNLASEAPEPKDAAS